MLSYPGGYLPWPGGGVGTLGYPLPLPHTDLAREGRGIYLGRVGGGRYLPRGGGGFRYLGYPLPPSWPGQGVPTLAEGGRGVVGTLGYPLPHPDLAGGYLPWPRKWGSRYLEVPLPPIWTWPGTPPPHLDLAGVPSPPPSGQTDRWTDTFQNITFPSYYVRGR